MLRILGLAAPRQAGMVADPRHRVAYDVCLSVDAGGYRSRRTCLRGLRRGLYRCFAIVVAGDRRRSSRPMGRTWRRHMSSRCRRDPVRSALYLALDDGDPLSRMRGQPKLLFLLAHLILVPQRSSPHRQPLSPASASLARQAPFRLQASQRTSLEVSAREYDPERFWPALNFPTPTSSPANVRSCASAIWNALSSSGERAIIESDGRVRHSCCRADARARQGGDLVDRYDRADRLLRQLGEWTGYDRDDRY